MKPIKIGILNLMHDKEDTNERFKKVLNYAGKPVDLKFYYPKMHYQNREVPAAVAKILKPLDLTEVKTLDAFIITGAPIERIPYDEITYLPEIKELLHVLKENVSNLLFVCWGGLVAAYEYFGINKLPINNGEKFFGVYPDEIKDPTDPLLDGLHDGFLAPHARYAELDHQQVSKTSDLVVTATTVHDNLFSLRTLDGQQNYLFAHLEYDAAGLMNEFIRETTAYPDQKFKRPENDFDPSKNKLPFAWENTQKIYFTNWINLVANNLINETEY